MLVAVIYNPATVTNTPKKAAHIKKYLEYHGISYLWYETSKEDCGEGATEEALSKGAELIIACGGDGTVRACIQTLSGSKVPLAILPGGTGNIVGRSLKIPTNLQNSLDVAISGLEKRIDLGDWSGEKFALMGGVGFDGAIMQDASRKLKSKLGSFAYVLSGLNHMTKHKLAFTLTFEDGSVVEHKGSTLLVGNFGELLLGKFGRIKLMPGAAIDDGQLDVAVIDAYTVRHWFLVSLGILLGLTKRTPNFYNYTIKALDIQVDKKAPAELDGDTIEELENIKIQVLPGALSVKVPSKKYGLAFLG